MFERIVLAVDDAEEMELPIRIALDMVERYGAGFYPIHVVDLPQNPSLPEYYERQSGKVDWDDVVQNIEDRGGAVARDISERIDEVADSMEVQAEATCRIGVGDPAETIMSFAEDRDAGLIIIGMHSRKGLERILNRSVSGEVVRGSKAPVLTVHV
ncbi:MAG: Universal stress protein [Methanonatronarchaeales archaeon]|nr:Universal stress protein [Methanonatronarchaeales archaeon]